MSRDLEKMATPSQFNLYVRSPGQGRGQRSRLLVTIVAGICLVATIALACRKISKPETVLAEVQGSAGETIKVQVPVGANPGQILRVIVPGHSGTVFAKIPDGVSAGKSFLVTYSTPAKIRESVLPVVTGASSAVAAEQSSSAAGDAQKENVDSVTGMPLHETRLSHGRRAHLSKLSNFMDPNNPQDWRDTWTDPTEGGGNMAITDVLQNSAEMVTAVKRMYQSARNKYSEYRHLSAAAAKAYARVTKAIRKAQLGGYVLGIKTPFPLPPNWQAATDPNNRIYYLNSKTGSTSWAPPGYATLKNEVQTLKQKLARARLERRSQFTAGPEYVESGITGRVPVASPYLLGNRMQYAIAPDSPYGASNGVLGTNGYFAPSSAIRQVLPQGQEINSYSAVPQRIVGGYVPGATGGYVPGATYAQRTAYEPGTSYVPGAGYPISDIVQNGPLVSYGGPTASSPYEVPEDGISQPDLGEPAVGEEAVATPPEIAPDGEVYAAGPDAAVGAEQPVVEEPQTQARANNREMLYYPFSSRFAAAEDPSAASATDDHSLPALKPLRFSSQALRMVQPEGASVASASSEPLRVAIKDRKGLPVSSGYVLDR